MRELAERLSIPRETFQKWIEKNPDLAVYKPGGVGGGSWWVKVDMLASCEGLTPVDAYLLDQRRWVKAVDLAAVSGTSRRTIAHWCKNRPRFGVRIGRLWYVDLEQLGMSEEQMESILKKIEEGNPGKARSRGE